MATAAAFTSDHSADLRYCYARKKWLAWDGRRWTWEAEGEVERRAIVTVRRLTITAAATLDPETIRRSVAITALGRRRAMTETARHRLETRVEALDADDFLFNAANTSIDLSTGAARQHLRADLCTRLAPVAWSPSAKCNRWERFLAEVFVTPDLQPDLELIAFIRRAVGYSLTGCTGEQVFFMLVGPTGANGKSVFLGTLAALLGDYATTLGVATLLSDKHGRNKGPELLPLLGARLAMASEPGGKSYLDESLVKSLTGQDRISVNPKYEAVFDFVNKAKLWLACNAPPSLWSGGGAMARRIVVIPFRRHFKGAQQDHGLSAALIEELPGILSWAVGGCLDWQRLGLAPPATVTGASEEYAEENDPIKEWLASHVTASPGRKEKLTLAGKSYAEWREFRGDKRAVEPRDLAKLLRSNGYTVERAGGAGTVIRDVFITLPAPLVHAAEDESAAWHESERGDADERY